MAYLRSKNAWFVILTKSTYLNNLYLEAYLREVSAGVKKVWQMVASLKDISENKTDLFLL